MVLDVDSLCKTCCRIIAEHLADLIHAPQLAELIHESASSIQEREDVDSVPIIDDIRYYIAQNYLIDEDSEGKQCCSLWKS